MKHLHSLLLVQLMVSAALCRTNEELSGLYGIPFGTSRDQVVATVVRRYDLRPDSRMPDSLYRAADGTELWIMPNGLYLSKYTIGLRDYSVAMEFNEREQFCAYILSGAPCREWEIETRLRREVRSLSRRLCPDKGFARRGGRFDEQSVEQFKRTRHMIVNSGRYGAVTGTLRRLNSSSGRPYYLPVAAVCDKRLRSSGNQLVRNTKNNDANELSNVSPLAD